MFNKEDVSFEGLPEILTAVEAIELLGISKKILFNRIKKRGFPSIKIGRRYIIPTKALEAWFCNGTAFDKRKALEEILESFPPCLQAKDFEKAFGGSRSYSFKVMAGEAIPTFTDHGCRCCKKEDLIDYILLEGKNKEEK